MLTLVRHPVQSVTEGDALAYSEGALTIDAAGLARSLSADDRLADARVHLVHSGTPVRVLNVLDVFDARWREDGPTYAGFDGPPAAAGTGVTHVLDGLQIVASATLPTGRGGLMVARQAFLDYWGEGQRHSPFAHTTSLVLELTIDPSLQDKGLADEAVRNALILASTTIGRAAARGGGDKEGYPAEGDASERRRLAHMEGYPAEGDASERRRLAHMEGYPAEGDASERRRLAHEEHYPAFTEREASGRRRVAHEEHYPAFAEREASGRRRVAYVYQIQSQGPPLQTFLYGAHLDGLYPTLIDPVEILDGALVSGNHGLQTTPTIAHCNNPVVRRLLAEDGVALLPVVVMEGHHKTTPLKQRSAERAVRLLQFLRAEAAVFTQEGGGMSIVDQMMTIEGATAAGIECVGITYEMAGPEGTDTPLIYYSRAAQHLVSTGNRDEVVELGAPEQVLGDTGGASESGDLHGPVRVPLYGLYGSTAQVGAGRVRATAA